MDTGCPMGCRVACGMWGVLLHIGSLCDVGCPMGCGAGCGGI